MKQGWFNKTWKTGVRLMIAGLLVVSVTLIAYQSTLAQAFQRTTFVNHAVIDGVGISASPATYKETVETKRFERDDTRLAASQMLKARQMEEQQNYSAAEKLYEEALRIDEKTFGEDSCVLIADLRGLGNALSNQHKNAEAEAVLTRLVALARSKAAWKRNSHDSQ